jgi:colanic acid biosynthesis glycosyl transferase WcaI
MRVLVIGINYDPEPVGIGPFTTGTAQALAAAGHEVEVLTAKPYYPAWRIDVAWRRPFYGRSHEGGVAITRCPLYVPRRDGGLRRIVHHASFAAALLPIAIARARRFRPDLVLAIAPSLVSAPVARLAARMVGARLWLHIQDFEVEAAFATGLLGGDTALARLAERFEAGQLRAPDRTSSISPQMCRKLGAKGVARDRIVEFRNWADLGAIQPLAGPSPYRARWAITERHVALYSGNIANKQGIEVVIEAARLLRHRQDLVFVICGEGPNRANLEKLAAGLGNVQLHDLQPRERLGDLLGLATVHLLPQVVGAADLVLPSKLANMLASGRPLVATAAPGTGLAAEVEGVGLATLPGDAAAFAAAITALLDDPAEHARRCHAARQRAEERWSRQALLAGFLGEVERLAAPASAQTIEASLPR